MAVADAAAGDAGVADFTILWREANDEDRAILNQAVARIARSNDASVRAPRPLQVQMENGLLRRFQKQSFANAFRRVKASFQENAGVLPDRPNNRRANGPNTNDEGEVAQALNRK